MTIQCISDHGFRDCQEVKTQEVKTNEELDAGVEIITDCLVVLFVVALTAVFVVSFSVL